MKTKLQLQNAFVAFVCNDWKLPALCFTLVIALQGYCQPRLVKDINTQIKSGAVSDFEYTNFAVAGSNLFYVMYGNQLWRTATAGTSASFVKEIDGISNLTNVNGRLFFTAATIERGVELWKSDGTSASTVMVKDIRAGGASSSPSLLTDLGGTLFFAANDGLKGVELWKSDGSLSGTVRVKDISGGSSYPSNLIASNGFLYFSAHDGQSGYEMWKSDGTSAGTVMIKDLRSGYKVGSNPQQFVKVDNIVFFTALIPTGERRLFKTDGTSPGTALVSDVPNHVKFMTDVNGTLFFAGTDAAHGEELWKSDGTAAGTFVVKDITPGPRSENSYGIPHLAYFRSMGDKLCFFAHDDGGQRLWISDGTEVGTIPLVGPYEVSFTWIEINPIAFAGKLYFNADLDGGELSMMRTDGTLGGDEIFLEDVASVWDIPQARIVANNFLYFMSSGNLWKADGTNKYLVRSPFTSTHGSDPEEITDVNGIVYFGAYDGKSHGLWKSNATKTGTTLVKRFGGPVSDLTPSGNYLYYQAKAISTTTGTYSKLWRTDVTTGDTRVLSNVNPHADDAIGELADADGTLFFSAMTRDNHAQLWKTTGDAASTVLVKSFNSTGIPVTHLTTVGKSVFFSTVGQAGSNDALWRSDGTAINTNIIKVFSTMGSGRRAITEMIRVNQTIFYIAYDGTDYEIWKTNGSGSGTLRLKDIGLDDRDVIDVRQLTNIDNTLYFLAAGEKDDAGQYNRDLWRSNGTATGTVKVRSFAGALQSPAMDDIFILGGLNGSVLLGMQTSYWDGELWKTDGTLEGTQLLGPQYFSLRFLEPTVINNILYFNTGSRLWRSDGTACGTYMELAHVGLGDLTYSDGKIFLAYEPWIVGRELFIFTPAPSPCDIPLASTEAEPGSLTISNKENISGYPNPFVTEFAIRVNGQEGELYQAMIMDLNGMQQGEIMLLQLNMEYNLGARLKPGIYSLVIRKQGETVIKKIVKSQ